MTDTTDKISLKELATEDFGWKPYNSVITPIGITKQDDRIYLLLMVSDDEGIAYNRKMKRIGVLSGDEASEFYEMYETSKIKTEAPTYDPKDSEIVGVGHFYDEARS